MHPITPGGVVHGGRCSTRPGVDDLDGCADTAGHKPGAQDFVAALQRVDRGSEAGAVHIAGGQDGGRGHGIGPGVVLLR